MKKLLKEISELAIKSGDFTFTAAQSNSEWLGNAPASEAEVKLAEDRLGVQFPEDYKNFLALTNRFSTPNENIEPTFEKVEKITFLQDIDPFLIEVWSEGILAETGKALSKSIVIAGVNREQSFLLVPPDQDHEKWQYWKFANWIPGVQPFENLETYFASVLNFLIDAK